MRDLKLEELCFVAGGDGGGIILEPELPPVEDPTRSKGNNGFGNGGGDGVPGRSGFQDVNR